MNSILKPLLFLTILMKRQHLLMRRDIIRGWKIMLSNLEIRTQEEVLYEDKAV